MSKSKLDNLENISKEEEKYLLNDGTKWEHQQRRFAW